MRLLDGAELAGFIKERQAKQVRALRQSWKVEPRLAIIRTGEDAVTESYLRLKKRYGEDVLVDVVVYNTTSSDLFKTIETLNNDATVHGIIIQLPLEDMTQTDLAVNMVAPEKDVDGLGEKPAFTAATALAINWLLAGYGIELKGKKIAVVGSGRLVGAPLAKLWESNGYDISVYNSQTGDLAKHLIEAQVIVSGTGTPGLISASMIAPKAIVVDAGTASENGRIVGDLALDVRDRQDLTITPEKGGVGPLTVTALFDNVIQAARIVADKQGQQDIN